LEDDSPGQEKWAKLSARSGRDEIAQLCSKDWGIYTTFTKSLEALLARAEALSSGYRNTVVPGIQKLMAIVSERPKSLAWKMRARIGEKRALCSSRTSSL
jgi:hypothetical protein